MKTYQDLTIDELRTLFYAAAIVGSESGFYKEDEAKIACSVFEVFAKNLEDPRLIKLGLETIGDVELEAVMN